MRNLSKSQSLVSKYGSQVSLLQFAPSGDLTIQFRSAAHGFDKIVHSGYTSTAADSPLEDSVIAGFLEAARETSQTRPVSFVLTTGGLIVGETHTLVGSLRLLLPTVLNLIGTGSHIRRQCWLQALIAYILLW